MYVGASSALSLWGVRAVEAAGTGMSEAYQPALDFLRIRALGAPVSILFLTLQVGAVHQAFNESIHSSGSSSMSSSSQQQ